MKISKAKLRQIIKEELAEAEETPRMSPSEAGAKWTEDEEIFKAAVYAAVDANRRHPQYGRRSVPEDATPMVRRNNGRQKWRHWKRIAQKVWVIERL